MEYLNYVLSERAGEIYQYYEDNRVIYYLLYNRLHMQYHIIGK